MTHKATFLITLSLLASSAAVAADNRIKTVAYDSEEIVGIVGHAGIQSTIQFGLDERIENVAVGDSSAWQVTPNRRGTLLFVKPLLSVSRTNMTVVTDKRTYMFDLRAGGKAGLPLYALKFSYPDLPPVTVALPTGQPGVTIASASIPETTASSAERLNFDWKVKGSNKVRPARIFDDGTSLYLSWAADIQLPAILTAVDKGKETPLDYRLTGEYIVLSPVPQNIVLRHGKNAAMAWTSARPRAPDSSVTSTQPAPVQQSEPVVPDNRFALRAVQASAGPQRPVTEQNSVKAPGAADLLSDKLTDGNHDH